MKKNKYMNVVLISMMLLNTFLTPQMVYAVSGMTADESLVASQVEPTEPVMEVIENDIDTSKAESEEVELVNPSIEEEPAEDEKAVSEDDAVINKEPETIDNNSPPVEEEDTKAAEEAIVSAEKRSAVEQNKNLITSFDFVIQTTNGEKIKLEDGSTQEVDMNEVNTVQLSYGITKPDDLDIVAGDTYTIQLPDIFGSQAVEGKEIIIDGVLVAEYSIMDKQLTITFNENVNEFDNVEMDVHLSGSFNKELFETEKEVVVKIPYSEGNTYTTIVRAKQQEYESEDKKTAGTPYVLDEEGNKQEGNKNPAHVDWTVIANDAMETYENAAIIDDLGNHLEIVEDSITVYQLIRNYKNEEINRIKVDVNPVITENGFELNLGSIEDAYEVTYTTRVARPEGGGTHSINNSARIILDGEETPVKDSFDGTWSGDLPVITKSGSLADIDTINWIVEYNYGKEDMGKVTLTDTLSKGEIDLESIKVYEVDTDIDGNVVSEVPVTITPETDADGAVQFPGLDANGKAYRIEFSSSVPAGLNESIFNTITDDLKQPNSADASVPVNTIPTGGKVGEQRVDEKGRPYIDWTITMNSSRVEVPTINVKDVFSKEHLEFDVKDKSLYTLTKDGEAVENFDIQDYEHTDGRSGFELTIHNAGSHEYKFVYRTYYTELGMNETTVANNAELVFSDSNGIGIGESIRPDINVEGPKAGMNKSGNYVVNGSKTEEQIEWTINFNESKVLLNEGSTITDNFTSNNYSLIADSLSVTNREDKQSLIEGTDYTLTASDAGFVITLSKPTHAKLQIKYKTTADETNNVDRTNKAILKWQGGSEDASATVKKRDPGINKSGAVVINEDGSKTVNWTVNFNTSSHVIDNFVLTDTYSPTSVTVSNLKIMSGKDDVTDQFIISSERTGGRFTVSKVKLDAKSYQLTYSTTLDAEEEKEGKEEIKNTAAITYTGGNQSAEKVIPSPTLGVQKDAINIDKKVDPNRINWKITANTDAAHKLVNLVDAELADTIPADQRLIADSIKVMRVDNQQDVTNSENIQTTENSFNIHLPNGSYQYMVTFQTEIIDYPSVNEKIDRYTNSTELTNKGYKPVTDDAYIDYYGGGTGNHSQKSGVQNKDTEDIDWSLTINPDGLPIKDAKIVDTLSDKHSYVADSVVLIDDEGNEVKDYEVKYADDNRSFTIELGDIDEPYKISYSTRLNENLIGVHQVKNTIELFGGQEKRSIDKQVSETNSQQWFYGGGGSGRTVQFELNKQNSEGISLQGAEFNLERVNFDNSTTPVDAEVVSNEQGVYISGDIRAGRYMLTETKAPDGFEKLKNPIYFMIGYAETGEGYTATITNQEWKSAENEYAAALGNVLTIINDYKPVSVTLEAIKSLEGNKLLEENQFAFELLEDGKVLDTKSNNSEGNITFEALSYNKTGTYNYQIREVKGELGGVTYDPTVHNVEVTVANDEDGKLVATVSYGNNLPKFTNTYQAAPTNVVLNAKKILEGQVLTADQFAFELVDAEGEVLQTAKNNAEGEVEFDEITYNEAGEYSYTIREVKGELGGITYDSNEFPVKVTVTDNGTGQLTASKNYVNGPVVFTNTYTAKPGNVVLEASKILTGQELVNGQFEFELVDSAGEVIQTSTNNADGQIVFTEIAYDTVGEYTYTIREVQGELGGITYDTDQFVVKVIVEDNGEGNLVATANYMDGPAAFMNEYVPDPGSVVLEASKTLTGLELVDEQFSFELVDEAGEVIQTKTNNAEGQIIFSKIHYDTAGKYTYTIREVEGNQKGITYDKSEYTVVVDVVDNSKGNLVATKSYTDGPALFTNEYVPAPDRIVIEAEKVLEGQDLVADQFLFELVNSNDEVVQTATNNAEGQIIFNEISYDKVGEYTYTIREVEGVQGGVTYDTIEYEVVVTVTDDKEGNLHANALYSAEKVVFTNSYSANEGIATIEASKLLEGQSLRDDQFEFNLLDENEKIIQTATNNADGQVIFNALTFTESGQYSYFIEEANNKLGGITYDDSRYTATITVTDNGNGQLVTAVEYNETPQFTNLYTAAPDSVGLSAKKVLEGQALTADQFSFELVNAEGEVLQTVRNNAAGQIDFDDIIYDKVGEHTYTIREVKGELGGVTYDASKFKVDVKVTDNGKGQLIATANYIDGPATFTNEYVPAPDSIVLGAKKILEGQKLTAAQFAFELVNADGEVLQTAENNAEGQVIFDAIAYDEVGEHTYTIREVQGELGGVTYDASEFKVDVKVTDKGKGQLLATVNYVDGPATFTNEYVPAPDSVVLEASKTLTGLELVDGQFSFELVDEAGEVIQTSKNNTAGQIIFDEITYDEVGEHTYTVREVKGNQSGITYDTSEFVVNVIVEDNGEGNLVATANYTTGPADFINAYVPAPDGVVLEADKILEGQDLVADQFAFELVNAEGEVLQTVKNNAAGQVIFNEITYDEVGNHTYTIREVKGELGGVTYDTSEFTVDVTIADEGKGQLLATESYVDGPPVFTNTYTPEPDSVVLEANKTLTGQNLIEGQFEFELVNNAGEVIQTSTNNAAGQIIFDEITYGEVGEYTYIIREVKGVQGGVAYDTNEFAVNVIVADNGEGNLVAAETYIDGPAAFVNEYVPASDSVVFEASKTLTGLELVGEQFSFELVDETGEVIQTSTNNAAGQIIFDEITYDEAGEYTYIIREVKGNQNGITYDTNEFEIKVIVEDNGEGNLVATETYSDGLAVFTNEYVPAQDSVALEAEKILNGQELTANQFAFELVNAEGEVLQTVENNAAGQIIFEEMDYDTAGTYTYTIREVQGKQIGITYDSSEYTIVVEVVDNKEGQLVATATYTNGPATFINEYIPVEPAAPIVPTEPTEPTDLEETTEQVKPAKPSEPAEIGDSEEAKDSEESKLPKTGEAASYTGIAVMLLITGVSLAYYERKRSKNKTSK